MINSYSYYSKIQTFRRLFHAKIDTKSIFPKSFSIVFIMVNNLHEYCNTPHYYFLHKTLLLHILNLTRSHSCHTDIIISTPDVLFTNLFLETPYNIHIFSRYSYLLSQKYSQWYSFGDFSWVLFWPQNF